MAVNSIYSNAIKLNRLIGDILDVQKLELNKMEFHNKPFGVDDMLKSICESYNPTFDSSSVKLVNNCKIHTVMYGDIHRLEQVLNNIINNSLDFISKDTGNVKINAIQKENSVIFTIEDNGVGISKENQKNLFKACYDVLRPGGKIVYATCSLEPEENEENVKWFEKNFDVKLVSMQRYWPTENNRGFFTAKFIKKND